MNVTKVELPDGRLVTIEGGNAENTARFLQNQYLTPNPVTNTVEEPLPVPGWSQKPAAPAPAPFVVNTDEEPLPLPSPMF